ncbi:DNA polymerase III subunit delta [Atopobium fossor]|uniref:DNA polymerase III subunit delta n=1 Tax=Atopobium fossor TaxID=39487 RepID=UPI000428DD4F|nr:DNA polymerase III subunit delta [Atopobium fossor]
MTKMNKENLLVAYLLVGTDELKQQRTIARLKQYLDPDFADFNLEEHLSASGLEAQVLISSLQALPFGDSRRFVIVWEADKLTKEVSEALVSYLADSNPSSILVLIAQSLAKSTRLYKAVANVGAKAVIDCGAKKKFALATDVIHIAQVHGLYIDTAAAQRLIFKVGESTIMLDNQLASLASRLGVGATVHVADIDSYVTQSAEVNPWEFLDVLCSRDFAQSMELFHVMKSNGYVALQIFITSRLRELICVKALQERGTPAIMAQELGKQDWQIKKYPSFVRKFAPGELEELLKKSKELEWTLKNSSEKETAFIQFIAAVCGK